MILSYSNYPQYSVNYPQYFGGDGFKPFDLTEDIRTVYTSYGWNLHGLPSSFWYSTANRDETNLCDCWRSYVPSIDFDADNNILLLKIKNVYPVITEGDFTNSVVSFVASGLRLRDVYLYSNSLEEDGSVILPIDYNIASEFGFQTNHNFNPSTDVSYKIIPINQYFVDTQPIEEGDTE